MKLVIDLPEEDFRWNGKLNICWCSFERLIQIVSNGTPLPKGHGRLKDIDRLESHDEYDGQGFTKSVYKDDIDNAPTIIEGSDSEC